MPAAAIPPRAGPEARYLPRPAGRQMFPSSPKSLSYGIGRAIAARRVVARTRLL